jgi:hypothetical protein
MEKHRIIIESLGRFGCFSIALVYIMVGLMAILSFAGEADAMADEERIVDVLLDIPAGEVIILIMIAGLLGYIIWRVFEAFKDPYNFGSHFKGIAIRTGIGLSAVGYAIIGFSAFQVLLAGGSNGEQDQQMFVSKVFEFPGGLWIVGAAGLITALAGIVQFKYVGSSDYKKRIKLNELKKYVRIATHILAWAGYLARGIILCVIGFFIIRAAVEFDPKSVGDTDSAFDFIGDFGMLGELFFLIVAIGTICYGLFMIISGIYYRFEDEGGQP